MVPKNKLSVLLATILGTSLSVTAPVAHSDDDDDYRPNGEITIIHIGDIHGHLTPRPNLRSDGDGRMEGGLARMFTKVKSIRGSDPQNTLLVNTGDTIQGSGEALYTRGQALVTVLDKFKIGAYTPGNWDFVYGPDRFKELFVSTDSYGNPVSKRWGGLVANVYETDANAPKRPTADDSEYGANLSQKEWDDYSKWYLDNGKRILPPTAIKTINGVKVGIFGCTTSRGPQVVGSWVTNGLEFTDCAMEIPKFAKELRAQGVDMVMMISEIEISRNIQLLKSLPAESHIDVVLNSDMHEETIKPISVTTAGGKTTLIVEEGQDGTQVGELNVKKVAAGQVTMSFKAHRIHSGIEENDYIEDLVEDVSERFNEKFDTSIACGVNSPYVNPFTVIGLTNVTDADVTCLQGPLDKVVGRTDVGLHRSNFSNENMPAAVEGTSHDFIADAIRWWAKSDMAAVRGFRYGTHVKPGPITRNDLYHFVPVGPRVGKGSRVSVNQMRNQIDNSSLAVFSPDPGNVVTPRPNYNNASYAPNGLNAGKSPGAGLPAYGGAGNARGLGGGWMFAYSGNGFRFDFDPYFTPNWHTYKAGSPFDKVNNQTCTTNNVNITTCNVKSGIYLANRDSTTDGVLDDVKAGAANGASYNGQYANPPSDTSRARNWMVEMPCDKLPVADKTKATTGWNGEVENTVAFPTANDLGYVGYANGVVAISLGNNISCGVGGSGNGKTVITKAKDGSYMPSWTAFYTNGLLKSAYPKAAGYTTNERTDVDATDGTTACNFNNGSVAGSTVGYINNTCGYTPYLVNPKGWTYLRGTPNQPDTAFTVNQHFKAALFKIAGYWYKQSPNTVNNCNNCYTGGSSNNLFVNGAINDNAAYLLPVNEDVDAFGNRTGQPALDGNGNPKVEIDGLGNLRWDGDKPVVAGKPIELTEVIVKYLAHLGAKDGGVTNGNLQQNRIGLVKTRADGTGVDPTTLPDLSTSLGFKVMQPLCGTIGKDPTSAAACP